MNAAMNPSRLTRGRQGTRASAGPLLRHLLGHTGLIAATVGLCTAIGVACALLVPPVYQAEAVLPIGAKEATTEIELIKSRAALTRTVTALGLDTVATPRYFMGLGQWMAGRFTPAASEPLAAAPMGLGSYAWGGERIDVEAFDVPETLLGQRLLLTAGTEGAYTLQDETGALQMAGQVGELASSHGVQLRLAQLVARPGTEFTLTRNRELPTALLYQQRLELAETRKDPGSIYLAIQDPNPARAVAVLDEVIHQYRHPGAEPGAVQRYATLNPVPARPFALRMIVLAALAGALLAGGMVWLRHALRRGVQTPERIEQFGLPVYAALPLSHRQAYLHSQSHTGKPCLLSLAAPDEWAVESLRSLRTSLYFALLEARNNVVMITSPTAGMGTSFICANLAVVLAHAGKRVLLIDADLRAGNQAGTFGLAPGQGLADVLAPDASAREAACDTGIGNLSVIRRGNAAQNPTAQLLHGHLDTLLRNVSMHYDLVLVDTPPALAWADAAIVGRQAGTTLLVARHGQTTPRHIKTATRRLAQQGVQVKAVIFNALPYPASSTESTVEPNFA